MPRPDEGLIHAWLDGQLPADEAARVEQLAATDHEWAAAVAEARGLIAASSRILSSLDHAPAGVLPTQKTSLPAWRMPWWTKVAAAIVVVAGGSVLVFERANVPELATAPAMKPMDTIVAAPTANTPVTTQVRTAPVEKKTVVAVAPRVAAPESKSAMNSTVSTARSMPLAAETQRKVATVERVSPIAPPPALSKDVAAKAAETAPGAVAQATQSLGGVTALRTVGGAAAPARAAEPADADAQIARRASGVRATPAPANVQMTGARCFRVREPNASVDAGVLMRSMHTDGDTLRLESAQGTSGLRAWIVWRDGLGHGAMTAADGKGAVAIVATAAVCPTP